MRSIKFSLSRKSTTGWDAAVHLTEVYLSGDRKADQLLDELPIEFIGDRRAACQSLFLGALRHGHRTQAALQGLLRKKARAGVEAILLVSGYELLDADAERHPKIIHHAVERSKQLINRFEQGFLNAVLRKLPDALAGIDAEQAPAAYYSHPAWLVAHWQKEFPESYRELLEWNQEIPATYLKIYDESIQGPAGLEATNWPQFYRITPQISWQVDLHPLLNQGNAYIKDPSTRLAPALLAPQAGESVLDLCAAPGGKAYDMAHAMKGSGLIVAVDLPGNRIARLDANLSTLRSADLQCKIIKSDLLELDAATFEAQDLPLRYDAVMLDAPCSNTGVIQRRTDVKWRLRPKDIAQCAKLQLQLLHSAARFVRAGGRIVYSTCSIEAAENQHVVDAFLKSKSGQAFELEDSARSLPWETGHDGAGAFRLRRNS
ncbi:RsmB/NOP family class I SAM-dependent RNA methyltransferase [Coraliomargarita algicola]|uniref:RsmB/NOP family class I SAM-dependent RNA methyltransferase n=1 Tax=Coraliomargarita algicola TaxID=3092156 RepID=A0ABZ0RSU0_9BACT|nr:RsmB/NOP family class I SAM-dependent RNA methyltransferase [Coraliomargarita sp. J2-16]WPJ97957.1 RsmB/NOP family class I SAM-dependent RNA methyltransferase [Coraliomargarita sp. J2-16]